MVRHGEYAIFRVYRRRRLPYFKKVLSTGAHTSMTDCKKQPLVLTSVASPSVLPDGKDNPWPVPHLIVCWFEKLIFSIRNLDCEGIECQDGCVRAAKTQV